MRTCGDDDDMDALGVFTDQAPSCVRKSATIKDCCIQILPHRSFLSVISLANGQMINKLFFFFL